MSIGVAAVAGAGTVAVIVATLLGGFAASPAPTSEIAGATDVPVVGGDNPGVSVNPIVEETFDTMPMDSVLGSPWVVQGGSGANIVALPTSVDRSVRIRTSAEGDAALVCLATELDPGAAVRIGLDFLIGGRPAEAVPLLSVDAGDGPLMVIGVNRDGALLGIEPAFDPVGLAPRVDGLSLKDWRRIDAELDPVAGSLAWAARDASGVPVGGGTAPLRDGASVRRICLHSPEGAPSGWVAVDDVVVRG